MEIRKILKDKSQFLALTSLYPSEFEELLAPFSLRWEKFFKHFTLRGKRRNKPLTGRQLEASTSKLPMMEDKLFFILYFFKNNHIQQSLAAQFQMNQSQVSRWIKALYPLLGQSIKDLHLQAARDMDELVRLFRTRQRNDSHAEVEKTESLHLDVTERSIQRNKDLEAQKHDFSGKQKNHTLKNSVLCSESQFVHFAGRSFQGAVHDKKMGQEELPDFRSLKSFNLWLSKDKGYQKYRPEGVHLLEPFKASRNHPLQECQKEFNKWLASIRIVCEHAISGIKRCRLLKDRLRYFDPAFRDKIFAIGCGLHNLRVTRRKTSYACSTARVRARINLNFSPT